MTVPLDPSIGPGPESLSRLPGFWEATRFALPLMIGLLTQAVTTLVDALFIGQLGTEPLAGVPVAAMVYIIGWVTGAGVMRNAIAFAGRLHGGGNNSRVGEVVGQYQILALCSLPLLLTWIQIWPWLTAQAQLSPAVVRHGWDYLSWRVWEIPISLTVVLYSSVYQAVGNSRLPMQAGLVIMSANVFLDYGLIFGHFGFPALGVSGSALATALSQSLGAAYILSRAHGGALRETLNLRFLIKPRAALMKELLRIGLPQGLGDGLEVAAWVGFTLIVGRLGSVALAAHNIGIQVTNLMFLPGYAFGLAAASYMGRFLGAGQPDLAGAASRRMVILGVSYMALLGAPLWVLGELLARQFSADPEVIRQAGLMFKVMALYQVFDGLGFITRTALGGAGDTRVPALQQLLAVLTIMYPAAWVLSSQVEPGLLGAWLGAWGYMAVLAGLMVMRLRGGHWRTVTLLREQGSST